MFTTVFYALGAALIGFVYDRMGTYALVYALMLICVGILTACNLIATKGENRQG